MSGPMPAVEEGNTQPSPDALDQSGGTNARTSFRPQDQSIDGTASNARIGQLPNQNLTVSTNSFDSGDIGDAAASTSQMSSGASSTSPASTSDSASQSQHLPFGPPRPPSAQPNTQRSDNRLPQPQSVHEGVIHGILEGLFGPMMNPPPAGNDPVATATNASQPEAPLSSTPGGSTIGQNANRSGNQRPGNPDIGTMFSMFGFPPGMMPLQGNSIARESSVNQSASTSGSQAHGTNPSGQPSVQPQPSRFPSGFSFTFDLGPFDIPGPAGPSNSRNQNQNPSNQATPNPNMSTSSGSSGSSGSPGRNAAGAPAVDTGTASSNQTSNNAPNAGMQQPPFAFILNPDGTWMYPQPSGTGAAAGAEGNAESRPAGGNGQPPTPFHFHFPGGSVTAEGNPGGAPPLFQLFSQLFPNGIHPVVVGPGMMNFAFGPQSFMQTRLPPDPERAEELLRGLKDPGMNMMMRLDRVIRADYSQGMNVDGAPQSDGGEGDAEGWKCAVCMETFEDELEEHRQLETSEAGSIQSSSTRTNEDGRKPSISSDADMHDVEMVLAGETREIPKNKTSLKMFPCHHVFHEDCLRPWLAQKTTCPTCRFDVDPHSVTLRRPVVRSNPLRPRARNTASSNRATPYGSRPDTPAFRTENLERAASSVQPSASSEAAMDLDASPAGSSSSDVPAALASSDTASSGSVPTFTQSDAPRSPFAFSRSTGVAQSGVDTGHVDRPPPAAGAEESVNTHDSAGEGRSGSGQRHSENAQHRGGPSFDPAGMQEAVHMLHEILRRGNPEHVNNSNARDTNNNNSSNANQNSSNRTDAAAVTDGSAQNGDAPNGSNSSPRRHNSHTIAIFEIALPDMPAHMMPDTFQGPNDNASQPFGNGMYQNFMIPFGQGNNGMPISGNRAPSDNVEQSGASANAGHHAEASASGDAPHSSANGRGPSSNAVEPESGEGVRPAHPPPRLHRWRSDPEQRHATDPLTGSNGESATGAPVPSQQPPPMERRRGDHPWHPPHVKESFSEWIVSREKALHWRCDDPICLYAPPEHPYTELKEEEWREWKPTDEKLTKIKSYNQYRFSGEENTGLRPVCQHEFHPSCLKVSCLSSNWWYKEPGRQETTVRCPKCRMQGWVRDEEMQPEGAAVPAVNTPTTTTS